MSDKRKIILYFSLLSNVVFLIGFGLIIKRLGGINYFRYRMSSNSISAQYQHKDNLYRKLMEQKKSIVLLGDSITEAGEWAELLQHQKILNRGIAGDVTSGLLRRLDAIIDLDPAQIFLMIGINDLLFVSPAEAAHNYRNIVQKIRDSLPQCQLTLQSVLPINKRVRNIPIEAGDILDLNQNIKQIAADFGLAYIDLHPLLSDENGALDPNYTLDGIHINGEAYVVWARALKPYLLD